MPQEYLKLNNMKFKLFVISIMILVILFFIAAIFPFCKTEPETIIKTVYITRDTCDTDSDFINAIGEIETLNTDSLIGDSGRAYGRYQMHAVCVKGSGFEDLLNYQHKDMFDSVKSEHVFWATMGVHCYTYAQKYGKYPNLGELARMWNGGPNGHKKQSTLNYLKKFEQCQRKN